MKGRDFSTALLITTYNSPVFLHTCLESVAAQSVMPSEIIIADDGSTSATREVVDSFRSVISAPIRHVWHEDDGFRLTMIRNKGIAASNSDYIIQIDGDLILDRNFVADHIAVATRGCFVCGSRVMLTRRQTSSIVAAKETNIPFWVRMTTINAYRYSLVMRWWASHYQPDDPLRMRGCNMAFWREDLLSVNGYNEELTQWGHEDSEMALRLMNSDVKKRHLKFGGVVYHLYHALSPRDNEQRHYDMIRNVRELCIKRCENGLSKYIGGQTAV